MNPDVTTAVSILSHVWTSTTLWVLLMLLLLTVEYSINVYLCKTSVINFDGLST